MRVASLLISFLLVKIMLVSYASASRGVRSLGVNNVGRLSRTQLKKRTLVTAGGVLASENSGDPKVVVNIATYNVLSR